MYDTCDNLSCLSWWMLLFLCHHCASDVPVLYIPVKTSFFHNTGQAFPVFFHLTCNVSEKLQHQISVYLQPEGTQMMLLLHLSTSPVRKTSMTMPNGRDERQPPGFCFKLLRQICVQTNCACCTVIWSFDDNYCGWKSTLQSDWQKDCLMCS